MVELVRSRFKVVRFFGNFNFQNAYISYSDRLIVLARNKKLNKKNIIGVTALIPDKEGKILLTKRTENSEFAPKVWSLPCGKVEEGETPKECLIREMKEELGIEIAVQRLISRRVYETRYKNWKVYGYLCKILNGQPSVCEPKKCEAIEFISPYKIPKNFFKELLIIIENYKAKLRSGRVK